VSTFFIYRPSVIDDRQLRGGPAVKNPTSRFTELDLSTDSRHAITANGGVTYYWDDQGDAAPSAYLNASYRPVSNVSVSFGPSWNPSRNYAQYVTAISDSTATAFYGGEAPSPGAFELVVGCDQVADAQRVNEVSVREDVHEVEVD